MNPTNRFIFMTHLSVKRCFFHFVVSKDFSALYPLLILKKKQVAEVLAKIVAAAEELWCSLVVASY